jgi:hypothetical protein
MNLPAQYQRAVSDVLETGARLAARNALVFLRITALLTLPIGVLFGAAVVWLENSSGSRHPAIGTLVAVSVLYALAIIVAGAACLKVAAEAYNDAKPSARAAIELVARRLGPVVGLATLLVVGVAPAIAVLVLPGVIAVGNYALLLLGLALVSLWFSGAFAAALPAMLVEKKGIGDSLRRSAQLVRGGFFRALGTVLLGGILALFAGVLVAILVSVASYGGGNVLLIVALAGIALGELFVAPLFVSFLVVLYFDLRVREQARASSRRAGEQAPASIRRVRKRADK